MSAGPYAAIGLALFSATAYNAGLILEKRALAWLPSIDLRRIPRMIVNLLSSPAWLGGFGLMLAGHHADAIALAAVMVPMGCVGLLVATGPLRSGGRKHGARSTGVSAIAIVTGVITSPYLYAMGVSPGVAMLLFQAVRPSWLTSTLVPGGRRPTN